MPSYHRNNFRTRYFFRQQAAIERTPKEHWLLDYMKKNPLQSGTALATLYGVIAIFAYHSHIEYFPVFDLKSLASMVFAAAYTTLLTLIVFSFSLFAPCYFIATFGIGDESKKDSHALNRHIGWCIFAGFLTFVALCFTFLLTVDQGWSTFWLLAVIPVVLIVFAISVPVQSRRSSADRDAGKVQEKRKWNELGPEAKERFSLASAMLGTALMELVSMLIFFMMLRDSPLAQGQAVQWSKLSPLILATAVVLHAIGWYLVVAWCNRTFAPKHRGFSVMLALAAPVITSCFAGNPVLFFSLTAMTTKIGNFRAAELTLSNTGCQIIASSGSGLCVKLADGSNKLCKVHVMSRLGTESYLLVSYPHVAEVKKQIAQTTPPVKGAEPQAETTEPRFVRPEWMRDVYVPSKEILGVKLEPLKRNFTKEAIEHSMAEVTSQCDNVPKPAVATNKIDKSFRNAQLFGFDLYSLTASGEKALADFAQQMNDKKAATVSMKIVGHTDAIGSDYRNLQLSQLRALTVANYLRAWFEKNKLKGQIVTVDWIGVGSSEKTTADGACPLKARQAERVRCLEPDRRVEITGSWSSDGAAKS
jgi:outer membrane protein OmpA-like peptidoglycan-associated protein